jgi:hypothetical protein
VQVRGATLGQASYSAISRIAAAVDWWLDRAGSLKDPLLSGDV